jgi:hypothetical protein
MNVGLTAAQLRQVAAVLAASGSGRCGRAHTRRARAAPGKPAK